jgi:HlyD family secretion protein/epimerase transport system membrane fusion protein
MAIAETNPKTGASRAVGVLGPLLFALFVAVLFFGGLGAWSALAPLESATIAPGTIVVENNRKAVQHLEGGVVGRLLVGEGDEVQSDQLLVLLDQTLARATVEQLRGQLYASLALQARLKAERDRLQKVTFPAELTGHADDEQIREMMQAELRIFDARREQVGSQARILRQRNAQVAEEIRGISDEIKAEDRQLRLIREETEDVQSLVAKGLERKPRVLSLQRQSAEIEGRRAQNVARIARGHQAVGENELRILDLEAQLLSEAVQKLRDEEARTAELREKIRAADNILQRTEIRAPVAGRVQGLKVFTVGGVVTPRETIMEIVPADVRLIVEAPVATGDIDAVNAGQAVQLRFTAFSQRNLPSIEGRVLQVSADRMSDQRTGIPYYMARIGIDAAGLTGGTSLYPGMPVEVMIRTGSHTMLEYLTKPILDSMGRAMREG